MTDQLDNTEEHNCYSCKYFNGGCKTWAPARYNWEPCEEWEPKEDVDHIEETETT